MLFHNRSGINKLFKIRILYSIYYVVFGKKSRNKKVPYKKAQKCSNYYIVFSEIILNFSRVKILIHYFIKALNLKSEFKIISRVCCKHRYIKIPNKHNWPILKMIMIIFIILYYWHYQQFIRTYLINHYFELLDCIKLFLIYNNIHSDLLIDYFMIYTYIMTIINYVW